MVGAVCSNKGGKDSGMRPLQTHWSLLPAGSQQKQRGFMNADSVWTGLGGGQSRRKVVTW